MPIQSKIDKELIFSELEAVVGGKNIKDSKSDLVAHSLNRNWFTRNLRKMKEDIPLAELIVYPETSKEVAQIIKIANREEVPVIPYGGGSASTGGNIPTAGSIVIDLKKLNGIMEINDKSLSVRVKSGTSSWEFEEELNRNGYTSGHLPASHFCATLGGFIALRSAGRLSTKYGKIEDMILGLEVVLPNGEIYKSRAAPKHATGPDLDQLFIGSEGTLGIITKATFKIHPLPEKRSFRAVLFPNLAKGLNGMRKLMRAGLKPSLGRLYSEEETQSMFDQTWGLDREGSILIIGFEGNNRFVKLEREFALETFAEEGGTDLGEEKGKQWWKNRYKDYYPVDKKDAEKKMRLMGGGYGAGGTVDTCLPYNNALEAYEEVKREFRDKFGNDYEIEIYGHFSHWYKHGTMFYCRWHVKDIPENKDVIKIYNKVWSTLIPIVLKHGGVIEHHHGIGRNLGRFLSQQSEEGFWILKQIKKSIDPNNIMNPGLLGIGGYNAHR